MAKLDEYGYEPRVPRTGDWLEQFRAMDKQIGQESIAALANYRATGRITGCFWKHPVADGYAVYRVSSDYPLVLQHVTIGDAYAVPAAHIRGLQVEDIKTSLDWDLRWSALP